MTNSYLPAEWAPQSGLMLTWPHPDTDWGPALHEVEPVFVEITKQTSHFQPVLITCNNAAHQSHVRTQLQQAGAEIDRCRFYCAESNDSWVRDHGPVTVFENGAPLLLDFTFNGWGKKYPADLDNSINHTLYDAGAFSDCHMRSLDFVLEGGSLETDGLGTLLTTTSCLLSPHRNSGYKRAQIEAFLLQHLHLERIIWLQHGYLQGDDTDGHVDTLVRFADPQTLLYVSTDDPDHPDHAELQRLYGELLAIRQLNGDPCRLIALPCPLVVERDELLPASYANFVIINGAVLVPQYRVDEDAEVLNNFMKCFPDRTIIGIDCRPLIRQYGSLHCVTMNLPQGVIK